jgi:hypothetical protein
MLNCLAHAWFKRFADIEAGKEEAQTFAKAIKDNWAEISPVSLYTWKPLPTTGWELAAVDFHVSDIHRRLASVLGPRSGGGREGGGNETVCVADSCRVLVFAGVSEDRCKAIIWTCSSARNTKIPLPFG